MNIIKSDDEKMMTVELDGEVDSMTAPRIEAAVFAELEGVTDVIFDLKELEYISSAGLRSLQKLQKAMKAQGNMVIKNVPPDVMEIFKVTGFIRVLRIG